MKRLVLLASLLLISGCESLSYYSQAIGGQFQILNAARPIDAWLADLALGYAIHGKSGGTAAYVTAHLAVDYAGAAREGDWVESRVEIQRIGSRLAFANCYLVCARRGIVRASAIFARSGPPA